MLARLLLALTAMVAAVPVSAQHDHDLDSHEVLAADRPESWAMNYMAASSLMTGFGLPDGLAAGQWQLAADIGHIPHLRERQRRVGFNGFKLEDLNKSPVFGRVRFQLGLPFEWQLDLGYTPPVEIDGAQPRDLFAIAIGKTIWRGERLALAVRAHGQHGQVGGDITCPAELAIGYDRVLNPFGCQAPSNDRVDLNQYGAAAALGGSWHHWRWHTEWGVLRTEPEVQVDAQVFDVRDRSHLVARGWLRHYAVGIGREHGRWGWRAELLHVPIDVRRADGRDNDALTSFRMQLRYRPGD